MHDSFEFGPVNIADTGVVVVSPTVNPCQTSTPTPPPPPPSLLSRAVPSEAARTGACLWTDGDPPGRVGPGWMSPPLEGAARGGGGGPRRSSNGARPSIIILQRGPLLGASPPPLQLPCVGAEPLPVPLLSPRLVQPHLWSWEARPPAGLHCP